MNNFIVGQVSPDMLATLKWGTFVIFVCIIVLGGAFFHFVVPETKQLSLEEMDTVFGSSGTAAADRATMEGINKEIGLEAALRRVGGSIGSGDISEEGKLPVKRVEKIGWKAE